MLTREVPLPVPGALSTSWGVEGRRFAVSLPAVGVALPLAPFEVEMLFECFPAREVIKLFTAVATEQRIVVFSSNIALLAPIATAAVSLLFPLRWEHTFIPILPKVRAPRFALALSPALRTATSTRRAERSRSLTPATNRCYLRRRAHVCTVPFVCIPCLSSSSVPVISLRRCASSSKRRCRASSACEQRIFRRVAPPPRRACSQTWCSSTSTAASSAARCPRCRRCPSSRSPSCSRGCAAGRAQRSSRARASVRRRTTRERRRARGSTR